jgi:hypothetical protein
MHSNPSGHTKEICSREVSTTVSIFGSYDVYIQYQDLPMSTEPHMLE